MNLDFFKGKTVLITGNTGFKGSWLSEILYLAGANVIGYALEPEEVSLYNILNLDSKVNTVFADIRNYKKLLSTIKKYKPEIVIHLAAQPLVIESYKNPQYTFDTNIMGTVNLLEAVRNTNCVKSFLNVTTDKVYYNDESDRGFKEDDKLCGSDPYSNSKSCSELVTYSYKKSFFDELDYPRVSTARAGNVIGGGDFSENRIVPDCVRAAINNKFIEIRNPNSVRPYQHVFDCLKGYLTIIINQYNDKSFIGNYNIGPEIENCKTSEQLVKCFCEKWGSIDYVNLNQNSKKEDKFLRLDCEFSKNKLGWKNTYNLEQAIEKVVEWSKWYSNGEDIIAKTDEQIKSYFEIN